MKIKQSQKKSVQKLSVIVPENPFSPADLKEKGHCLCALNIEKLIEWWPGTPHSPHRKADKVTSIQRSLDWNRVAQIASYLLQSEIYDTDERINKYFRNIYEPMKLEPGREWPPRVSKVTKFEKSGYPVFSNVLLHVNGAKIDLLDVEGTEKAAHLVFDENDKDLNFFVIDGQHRINGAFLALNIFREQAKNKTVNWEIPAQIFLDLDPAPPAPPRRQAQIFIDVNYYQKKVDRSLVADLFPTTRVGRESLNDKEKAQDIGRKLMLEVGPLVGMIQIPGIKYGVQDVVTLATLNSAIEDIMIWLRENGINSLEAQTDFLAQTLTCWFEATGRFEKPRQTNRANLEPENVVYQGRVLVSVIALIPAIIWKLREEKIKISSNDATALLTKWFKSIIKKANLEENGSFISKSRFRQKGYLGAGGIGRFRDTLWASMKGKDLHDLDTKEISEQAETNKNFIYNALTAARG